MTLLIGITGKKRAGKNETGRAILRNFENGLAFGFADKLKVAAARSLGYDRPEQELIDLMDLYKETAFITINYIEPLNGVDLATDDPYRQHDLTGREYLQFFGTEGGRETYDSNFWVDLALPPASSGGLLKYRDHDVVVVTDVRFDNEAQRVRDLGGIIVEVSRPGTDTGDTHASEQPVDPSLVDAKIYNNGNLEQLDVLVKAFLSEATARISPR